MVLEMKRVVKRFNYFNEEKNTRWKSEEEKEENVYSQNFFGKDPSLHAASE